jgi:membrane protease YdiL (CAAX protease family)
VSQPVGGEGTQGDGAVWQRRGHATGAILTFLLLAFGWSWSVGLAAMHVRDQSAMAGNALLMLSGFGPSLAGLAVVAGIGGRSGLRDWLTRCLQWRLGWRWFALAFALPPVAMLLALALHAALGGTIAASPANGHILLAIVNFALVLVVGGPLGEEFGWRGYLLPAIAARLGWRWAGLVVGVLWGVWHLPLFFIADTVQSDMPLALFLLSSVVLSVLFAWLASKTGQSVLPALVLHTAINAWAGIIPVMPTADTARPFALLVGILGIVAVMLLWRADALVVADRGDAASRGAGPC